MLQFHVYILQVPLIPDSKHKPTTWYYKRISYPPKYLLYHVTFSFLLMMGNLLTLQEERKEKGGLMKRTLWSWNAITKANALEIKDI